MDLPALPALRFTELANDIVSVPISGHSASDQVFQRELVWRPAAIVSSYALPCGICCEFASKGPPGLAVKAHADWFKSRKCWPTAIARTRQTWPSLSLPPRIIRSVMLRRYVHMLALHDLFGRELRAIWTAACYISPISLMYDYRSGYFSHVSSTA